MKRIKYVLRITPIILVVSFWLTYYKIRKNKISKVKIHLKIKKYVEKLSKALDMNYVVKGLNNIPNEPSYMICSNHLSLLDPFVFYHIFNDPITFVAKKEVKKMPIINGIMKVIDGYFLERDNLKQEIKVMRKIQTDMLEKNIRCVIFPEGTRSKNLDGAMNEFKAGAFKYPIAINKSILPVCIYGTQKVLDLDVKKKKNIIHVIILEPLKYEDYRNLSTIEVSNLIHERIDNEVKKLIKEEKS